MTSTLLRKQDLRVKKRSDQGAGEHLCWPDTFTDPTGRKAYRRMELVPILHP